MCLVEIKFIGENMFCVYKEDKKIVYLLCDIVLLFFEFDMVIFNLGGIINFNLNNIVIEVDIIFFEIIVVFLNYMEVVDLFLYIVEVMLFYVGLLIVV